MVCINVIISFLLIFASVNQALSEEIIVANEERLYIEIEEPKNKTRTSVYDRPYSFWENDIDYRLIKAKTWTILGASVIGLGILYLMPESFTNWDKGNISIDNLFGKWWDNVSSGPVKDKDDFFLNYVTHPYWGAVYYMAARSSGASAPYSFLYSAIISTFFWEYGVEAFAEVPSIQDIIITPTLGSIVGEGFYWSKRRILSNDYHLLNSKALGHVAIFLMDPITSIASLFIKDIDKQKDIALYSFPTLSKSGNIGYYIMINIRF